MGDGCAGCGHRLREICGLVAGCCAVFEWLRDGCAFRFLNGCWRSCGPPAQPSFGGTQPWSVVSDGCELASTKRFDAAPAKHNRCMRAVTTTLAASSSPTSKLGLFPGQRAHGPARGLTRASRAAFAKNSTHHRGRDVRPAPILLEDVHVNVDEHEDQQQPAHAENQAIFQRMLFRLAVHKSPPDRISSMHSTRCGSTAPAGCRQTPRSSALAQPTTYAPEPG